MTMGDRIKEQRKANHMTQDELGEQLGVQKSAVAKWENGRTQNIKRSIIQSMAILFGCDPTYLMGFDEDDEEDDNTEIKLSPEECLLVNTFRNLNDEGQGKLLEYAHMLDALGTYKTETEPEFII